MLVAAETSQTVAANGVEYWSAATGVLAAVLLILVLTDSITQSRTLKEFFAQDFEVQDVEAQHLMLRLVPTLVVSGGLIVTLNAIAAGWGPPPLPVTVIGVVYCIAPLLMLPMLGRRRDQLS